MKSLEIKSIQNALQTIPTLYRKVRLVTYTQGITVRRAIREAIYMWLEKEMHGEELTRYMMINKDLKALNSALRKMKKICSETTEENMVRNFKEVYRLIKENLNDPLQNLDSVPSQSQHTPDSYIDR